MARSQNQLSSLEHRRQTALDRLKQSQRILLNLLQEEREKWNQKLVPLENIKWNPKLPRWNPKLDLQFNRTKAYQGFGVVFPTESPRDAIEGIGQAVQSILTGWTIGTASLILFPAALWSQAAASTSDAQQTAICMPSKEQIKALAKGVAVGSLAGCAALGLGVFNAGYQFLQGIIHTPTAHSLGGQDQFAWDPYCQTWVHAHSLREEHDTLIALYQSSARVPVDSYYYDLLGVPTVGATSQDIKTAYKNLVLQWQSDQNNPDKEEQAPQTFLKVTTAYQTLIDDDKRARYDQKGVEEAHTALFNIPVFFAILFGSQTVEPYVGTLTISAFITQLMEWYHYQSTRPVSIPKSLWSLEFVLVWQDESALAKRKRQVEIALYLVERIQSYNHQSPRPFIESCRSEAQEVSETAGFGDSFLIAIGEELQRQANLYLCSWWAWPYHAILQSYRHSKLTVQSIYKTGEFVLHLVQQQKEEDESGKQSALLSAGAFQDMLPDIMDMAWAHNRKDIASTVKGACRRVLEDAKSEQEGVRRAQALQRLGVEFARRGRESTPTSTAEKEEACVAETKARFEAAFELAAQKEPQPVVFPWIHLITCLVFLLSGCSCGTSPGSILVRLQSWKQRAGLTSDKTEDMILKKGEPLPTIRE